MLLAPCETLAADTSNDRASPSIAAQPNDNENQRIPGRQPGQSATLELAPQPSAKVSAPDSREAQEEHAFRKSRLSAEA